MSEYILFKHTLSAQPGAAASVLHQCLHQMCSGTESSVGQPPICVPQTSTHNHWSLEHKTQENRHEAWKRWQSESQSEHIGQLLWPGRPRWTRSAEDPPTSAHFLLRLASLQNSHRNPKETQIAKLIAIPLGFFPGLHANQVRPFSPKGGGHAPKAVSSCQKKKKNVGMSRSDREVSVYKG